LRTYSAKPGEVERKWYVIDAKGKVLGRLASQIATILRGKNKPVYTPHVDTGDFCIVINAQGIKLTGKKLDQKMFRRHSHYPSGLKETPYRKLMQTKPEFALLHAVKGMLPQNTLGRKMLTKLKVYAGHTHEHQAQQPENLEILN